MSRDNLASTINQLYRERKDRIGAPDIALDQEVITKKSTNFWPKPFLIIGAGSLVSFGILAVVSHLAKSPEMASLPAHAEHIDVDIVDTVSPSERKHIAVINPPLPPKPAAISHYAKHTVTFSEQLTQVSSALANGVVNVIELPELQTSSTQMEPVYKVMPSYPADAQFGRRSGSVKLSYMVKPDGKVGDIKVIASDLNRALEKSARQALSQWQFKPTSAKPSKQEVVFEFSRDAG